MNVSKIANNKDLCCACSACSTICPKQAIRMIEDEVGQVYPLVDEDKCVQCSLCSSVCCEMNDVLQIMPRQTIAATYKNKSVSANSSSGGIFAALAETVINSKGIVYGTCFTEDFSAEVMGIEKMQDLHLLQGSKYVKSSTENTFTEVKQQLESGRQVLFSGVPCQVAALKTFLQKDYVNLVAVDIVCHGTPSNKMLRDYLSYIQGKKNRTITEFCFRDKSVGQAYMLASVYSRKIAYSISFGSFAIESELHKYKEEIEDFYRISVREESAKKHLEKQMSQNIDVTLDPTLLLDKEDYLALTDAAPLIKEDYVFFYSINYPKEVICAAKEIANQMGLPIITAFTSFHTIICERHGIKVLYDAGPREFMNLIQNAKLVLTNSFHGTAFSIVLHKPFYHICKTINGALQQDDRIDSIINAMGIQNCNVGTGSPVADIPNIDWEKVDQRRYIMKEQSLDFLRNASA